MKPAFRIAVRRSGTTLCLAPSGELDLESCPAFGQIEQLADAHTTAVNCTMAGVPFMDLSGLHCLLTLAAHLEARGVALAVYDWQLQPRRLLDVVQHLSSLPEGRARERQAAAAALRGLLNCRARAGREHGLRQANGAYVPSGAVAGRSRRPGSFRTPA
ncbi:STAS domain-containing protein [Streptomyces sp. NPDC005409]|uniref:STAS domain-containing protein n=1 Tax=Streptomyces sp. NPDC005409 TaxID=3155342 RepID=UPI0034566A30